LQASGDVDLLPASDTQVGGIFHGTFNDFHVNSERSLFGNGSATINKYTFSMLMKYHFDWISLVVRLIQHPTEETISEWELHSSG